VRKFLAARLMKSATNSSAPPDSRIVSTSRTLGRKRKCGVCSPLPCVDDRP
jgi:hypothetical protein